ncbi:MAG TPA: hypothetical protein VFA81_04445 [Burkholderiales bacterium]|nr:hypothetical protein [Burkholderiales bacterium]
MIRTWSLYRLDNGQFAGRAFSATDASAIDRNIPEGHGAIEGEHDHLSRRVDTDTKQVVDWQPPQPTGDHEWNDKTRRWQLSAAAAEKQRKRLVALARIQELEAAQARRVRELLADSDPRLKAIDQEIAALRADL